MLTGVSPERHGIDWNDDRPDAGYPKVPTIFELAKRAGLTTGMATGKSKFTTLARPGTVDWARIAAASDLDVAARASEIIASHKPHVMVVHFPGADQVGHAQGWGSKPQIAALEQIDEAVGIVLKAIDGAGLRDSTAVLFSADHGGAGRRHTGDDPRHRHIPWIIAGPGVRKDHDLTSDPKLTVKTEDTFATACHLLGIEPGDVEGRPVLQILADRELLRSSKK